MMQELCQEWKTEINVALFTFTKSLFLLLLTIYTAKSRYVLLSICLVSLPRVMERQARQPLALTVSRQPLALAVVLKLLRISKI